jgi:hypothetical protein
MKAAPAETSNVTRTRRGVIFAPLSNDLSTTEDTEGELFANDRRILLTRAGMPQLKIF